MTVPAGTPGLEPAAVTTARARLVASRDLPLDERPEALDGVHAELVDALASLDDED